MELRYEASYSRRDPISIKTSQQILWMHDMPGTTSRRRSALSSTSRLSKQRWHSHREGAFLTKTFEITLSDESFARLRRHLEKAEIYEERPSDEGIVAELFYLPEDKEIGLKSLDLRDVVNVEKIETRDKTRVADNDDRGDADE